MFIHYVSILAGNEAIHLRTLNWFRLAHTCITVVLVHFISVFAEHHAHNLWTGDRNVESGQTAVSASVGTTFLV